MFIYMNTIANFKFKCIIFFHYRLYSEAIYQLEQDKITLVNDKRTTINNVINDIRNIQSQEQQIVLAQENVKYSQQTYDDDKLRLSFGKITTFVLTSDQQNLIEAQQNLLNEQITYINDCATYEQDTGLTLHRWHIKIKY